MAGCIASSDPALVIPYGCARVPARLADVPCVSLARTPRRMLRLSDGPYPLAEPPTAAQLADGAAQRALLAAHLVGLSDPWAALPRRLIARWLDFAAWRVAAQADALGARLARFGGLYRVEDF